MRNFKNHKKSIERRCKHLAERIEGGGRQVSWDKAELNALRSFMRIANVYEDARGSGGSHLENCVSMVRDVINEVLEEDQDVLSDEALERLEAASDKCTESLDLIHNITCEGDD